jgi:hypothetical protein
MVWAILAREYHCFFKNILCSSMEESQSDAPCQQGKRDLRIEKLKKLGGSINLLLIDLVAAANYQKVTIIGTLGRWYITLYCGAGRHGAMSRFSGKL